MDFDDFETWLDATFTELFLLDFDATEVERFSFAGFAAGRALISVEGRAVGEMDLWEISAKAADGATKEIAIQAPKKDASSRFSMPIPLCPVLFFARPVLLLFRRALPFFRFVPSCKPLDSANGGNPPVRRGFWPDFPTSKGLTVDKSPEKSPYRSGQKGKRTGNIKSTYCI